MYKLTHIYLFLLCAYVQNIFSVNSYFLYGAENIHVPSTKHLQSWGSQLGIYEINSVTSLHLFMFPSE